MTGDWDKLRRFRQEGDEEAFADLVRAYIDLVWTTAFRTSGDADLAGDVAQTVFADLARKADRLPDTTILAGWLHRAASFAARRAVRDEFRRRSRERQAMELELPHQPASDELEDIRTRLSALYGTGGKLEVGPLAPRGAIAKLRIPYVTA